VIHASGWPEFPPEEERDPGSKPWVDLYPSLAGRYPILRELCAVTTGDAFHRGWSTSGRLRSLVIPIRDGWLAAEATRPEVGSRAFFDSLTHAPLAMTLAFPQNFQPQASSRGTAQGWASLLSASARSKSGCLQYMVGPGSFSIWWEAPCAGVMLRVNC